MSLKGDNGSCLRDYEAEYDVGFIDKEEMKYAVYTITFSDDKKPIVLTTMQLKERGGVIKHLFTKSSCGALDVKGNVCDQYYIEIDVKTCNPAIKWNGTMQNVSVLRGPKADFNCPEKECVNNEVLFENSTTAGQTYECKDTINSYWDFGDGSEPSTESNPIHVYRSAGKYKVMLIVNSFDDPEQFCNYDTIYKDIEIIELPKLNPVEDVNVCSSEKVSIISLTGSHLSKITYLGGSAIGLPNKYKENTVSANSASIPAFTAVNEEYYSIKKEIEVVPFNELECPGDPINFDITVYPKPYMNDIPDATACGGNYVELPQPSSPVPGTNYTWSVIEGGANVGMTTLSGSGYISGFNAKQNNSIETAKIQVVSSNYDAGMASCGSVTKEFQVTVTPTPKFTLEYKNISECGLEDASITLKGLMPNRSYKITLNGSNGSSNKSYSKTSNGDGVIEITGLGIATYSSITAVDGSCEYTDNTYIDFHDPTKPNTPAIWTDQESFCEGASMTLKSSAENDIQEYFWTGPNGWTSKEKNPVISNVKGVNSGMYSLKVVRDKCTAVSESKNILVKVMPTVKFKDLPEAICEKYTFNTSNNVKITGDSKYIKDVRWSVTPNTGASVGSANSLETTIKLTQAGTYTIKLTYDTDCETNKVVEGTVKINPLPVVSVSADRNSICKGESVVLTATGADSYTWKRGSTTLSSTSASVTDNPTSNATYMVVGKNNTTGCVSGEVGKSVTVTVPFKLTVAGKTEICEGQNFGTFTASGAESYVWKNGESVVSNEATFTPPTPAAEAIYTVVGKKSSSACVVTETVETKIERYPVFKAPNDTFFCDGSKVTVNASGAYSYKWSNVSSRGSSTTISEPGNYTVTGVSLTQCESKPVTFKVEKMENPTVAINGKDYICFDATATLTAVGNGGTAPYSYKWESNTAYSENPDFTFKSKGAYTVYVKDKYGCTGKNSKAIREEHPVVSISGGSQFCNGKTLELTATGDGVEYYWNGGSENTSAYTANKTEKVTLIGIDQYGCEATASKNVSMRAVPILSGNDIAYYCDGSNTILKVKLDSAASGYSWNNAPKTTDNTFKADEIKSYSVVGYDKMDCPSAPFVIDVKKTLTPEVTITGESSICLHGEPITLTANVAKEEGKTYLYKWSTGATTESIIVPEGKGDTYTVNVTVAEGGCPLDPASHKVTLINNAKIRIDGENQFCTDSTIVLKGVVESENPVDFYWNESTTPSETINVSVEGKYTVKAKDGYGCVSNASLYVYQRAVPVLRGETTMYYCAGASTTLEVDMDSMASGYVWNSKKEKEGNTFVADETKTYTVVGYDMKNCPSAPFSIDVKETGIPAVTITGPATICKFGESITLTANLGNVDENNEIHWSTGETTPTITIPQGKGGTYTVTVTATAGECTSPVASHEVKLIENAKISIDGPAQFCTDSTIELKGVVESENPVKFYWNGSTTAEESITVSEGGTYKVMAEDEYGCKSNEEKFVNKRAVPVLSGLETTYYCQYLSNDLVVKMDSAAKGYVWNENPITTDNTYNVNSEQTVTVVGYDLWNCPTVPKNMVVKETKIPVIEIEGDTTVCLVGDPVTLTVNVTEGEYDEIIWSNGEKGKTITVREGTYTAYATISVCKSYDKTHKVDLIRNASISITGVDEICTDSSAVFTAVSSVDLDYVWEGRTTNKDTIIVSRTGTYKVEGIDKYGCKSNAQKSITQRDIPQLTIPSTAAYCQYDSIKLVATLNREANSYVWDGVDLKLQNYKYANEVRDYTVMAYDNLRCPSNTATVAVSETTIPIVTIEGPTHVCQNGDAIVLTANVEGVHDRYEWNTNETTQTISVQYGGQFIARAFVGVCASAPDTFDVEFKKIPQLSITEGPSTTYCDLLGVTLHAVSPTATKYRWEPEAVETAENHVDTEGIHTVYVEDEFGCKNQESVETFVKYGPRIDILGDTTLCEFSITEVLLNCPECVSHKWSTGETTESIIIYAAGTYMVEGIGPNGCPNRAYHKLEVTPAPELEIFGETEILSNDSTTLTAVATGVEPFRFYWTPSHEMGNEIVVHSEDFDQWQNYTCMVYDKNNCYNFESVTVTKHSVKLNGKKDFCEGDSTTLTAVGNGIVSLKWSTGETTSSITLKDAGLYSIISTHDNGMVDTLNFEIIVHPNPQLEITGDLSICRGDSSFLVAEGDAKEYYWNTGINSDSLTVREAGEYSVTAISKYGCISYDTVSTIIYELPDVSIVGPDTVLEDSSIFLKALGAITYHWETPDTISEQVEVFEGGRYHTVGIDEHNCMNSAYHDVRTIPVPHPLINDTTNGFAIACVDDRVMLVASGAETYLWNTGETSDTIYVTESRIYTVKGCLSNGQCRETTYSLEFSPHPRMMKVEGETKICADSFSVFTAFTYNDTLISHFVWSTGEETQSVMVRDSQEYRVSAVSKYGCLSDTLSVTLAYHPYPEPLITGLPEVCSGNQTRLYANGGTRYLWIESGEETEYIDVATPGKRVLRAWNEFGCVADTSVFVEDRGTPVVSISGVEGVCDGDSAVLSAVGDQLLETYYLWNTGDTTSSIVVKSTGDYSVTLTNRAGCVAKDTVHFEAYPNPVIDIDGVDYVCDKDSSALKTRQISGNKIVKYIWSTGEIDSVVHVTQPGMYSLQVVDIHECISNIPSHEIKSTIPSPTPWITGIPEVCSGSETRLTAHGGASYLWIESGETTDFINVSKPGKRVLRAWSEFGCKADTSIFIENRGIPMVSVAGKPGVCDGDSTILSATGVQFIENYYLWNTGDTTSSIVVDKAGDYSVVLTNRAGCTATDTLHFEIYPNPVIDIDGVDYVCVKDSTELRTRQVSGNKIVKYSWSTGDIDSAVHVTQEGVYTLQVVDVHSCYSNIPSHEIKKTIPSPEPWITGIFEVCSGSETRLTAHGGISYLWIESGESTDFIDVAQPGKRMLRAWNEYGCKADTSVFVEDRGIPVINVAGMNGVCEGDSATLTAEGIQFIENYYLWNTGDTTKSIVVDKSGDYSVVLTNRAGCTTTDTLHFEIYPNPVIDIDGGDFVCVDDSMALKCKQISGNKIAQFSWNTGETDSIEYVSKAGTYSLQVVDIHTCFSNVASHDVQMRVPNPVTVKGDFDICSDQPDTATVVAYSEGAAFYSWLENTDTLVYGNPEFSARQKGIYRVVTTDSFGCRSYKDVEIRGHRAPFVRIYGAEIPVCGPDTAVLMSASEEIVVGYEWNTGEKTNRIVTDHSGEFWMIGTDIYGCYAADTVDLVLNDIPGMHIEGNLGFCPDDETDIRVVGAQSYLWSNGSNNSHSVFHEEGDYSVHGVDKYGCEKTIDFHVVKYFVPEVELVKSADEINRKDPTVNFSVSTKDDLSNTSFLWSMGDGGVVEDKEFDYTFDLSALRVFKVVMAVNTVEGCTYNRETVLRVDLDIPNTITPNGDGINDVFMEGFEVEIFDRHGKRVFYGNNGWNGYLVDGRIVADTYYYVLIDVTGEIYRGYVTVRQ